MLQTTGYNLGLRSTQAIGEEGDTLQDPIVFNIQRFSLHDGGGIRTILFFKGCPLRCPWCSNPEGISAEPEILLQPQRCIQCYADSVFACTKTPEECPTGAKAFAGRRYTVEELKTEALKDAVFYGEDGGITISGGEPLLAIDYLSRFLPAIKQEGVHIAAETTGNVPRRSLEKVMEWIDLFLFDLKILEPARFAQVCAGNSGLVVENFKFLCRHKRVIPRLPLIPGYTDGAENLRQIRQLVVDCGLKEVHILPYHSFGRSKYTQLGQEYTLADLASPLPQQVKEVIDFFAQAGILAIEGGY